MTLWAVLGAMIKRQLERARNVEREQERRLLEAYARGRKRRRENKEHDRKRERRLLGTQDPGAQEATRAERRERYPGAEAREKRTLMSNSPKKILVATDGSEDADLAARAAIDLSNRTGAELYVVHARQDVRLAGIPPTVTQDEYTRALERWEHEDREFLEEQAERLSSAGGAVAGTHLKKGRPADEIAGLAEELGVGLVVTGSRGLGAVKRLVVGSVSEGVVSLASCPVLVMRGGEGAWPPTRIVVGADLSEEAKKAAELAMGFRDALGAEVLLVLAYERRMVTRRGMGDPRPLIEADRARKRALGALSEFSARLESVVGARPEGRAALGDAASVIQEAAEEGEEPTLVVVGRRGMGAVARFALGSVSSAVLRSVSGPVLIVPSLREES